MPIQSTGCATCRKRKIRCDETRPGCNRCRTHGVKCLGYRFPAPGQVEFCDQTKLTVTNAQKQYNPKRTSVIGEPALLRSVRKGQLSDEYGLYGGSNDLSISKQHYIHGMIQNECVLDFANAMAMYATPQYLPSPAAEKAMIYSTFVDTYLPKQRGAKDLVFSFLEHLITSPGLRSEVSNGLDALSLVQVGSVYKDRTLLQQAVRAYSKSLAGLSKTLATRDFVRDDYVLATASILASCEFYDEIASVGDGWYKHIKGSQQLLAARGPESIQGDLALTLYANMRHGALSHALIARKACFLGEPKWRAVAWRLQYIDLATIFYDTALQVPAVLERCDDLDFGSATLVSEIDGVLKEANRLESALRQWLQDVEVDSKFKDAQGDCLYWLTDINDFGTFTTSCADRTMDQAYKFPNFTISFLFSVYWNVMHFLRSAIQNLQMVRHSVQRDWFPAAEEAVTEEELLGYVMDLCRCFPFFCEPMNSSMGHIGLFLPLRTAALYFLAHKHWHMLKWVGAVRDSVFTKGIRPPEPRRENLSKTP